MPASKAIKKLFALMVAVGVPLSVGKGLTTAAIDLYEGFPLGTTLKAEFDSAARDRSFKLIPISELSRTGEIKYPGYKTTYDANKDDALNQAINTIVDLFIVSEKESGSYENWRTLTTNKEGRKDWEQYLFQTIVSKRGLGRVSGLKISDYRTENYGEDNQAIANKSRVVTRSESLNDLSGDIGKSEGFSVEYDCEQQAALVALLAYRIEQRMFANIPQEDVSIYNRPADYQMVIGSVNGVKTKNGRDGGQFRVSHAYIISPLTSAIIEATNASSFNYNEPVGLFYDYHDFKAGLPFITKGGDVYSGYAVNGDKGSPDLRRIKQDAQTRLAAEIKDISEIMRTHVQELAENPDLIKAVQGLSSLKERGIIRSGDGNEFQVTWEKHEISKNKINDAALAELAEFAGALARDEGLRKTLGYGDAEAAPIPVSSQEGHDARPDEEPRSGAMTSGDMLMAEQYKAWEVLERSGYLTTIGGEQYTILGLIRKTRSILDTLTSADNASLTSSAREDLEVAVKNFDVIKASPFSSVPFEVYHSMTDSAHFKISYRPIGIEVGECSNKLKEKLVAPPSLSFLPSVSTLS